MLIFPSSAALKSAEMILGALASASPAVLGKVRPRDVTAWAEASHSLARARTRESVIVERPLVRVAVVVWRTRARVDPSLAALETRGGHALQVVQEALLALSLERTALAIPAHRELVLAPARRLVRLYDREVRPPAAQ